MPRVTTEPSDRPVGRRARPSTLARRGSWFAVVVLVGGVAASGCAGGADQLDMARVRRAVDTRAQTNYPGVTLGRVRCPTTVDKRRRGSFVCTLPVGGATLRIRVTQVDANGRLRLEAQQAVIQKAAAEYFVTGHASITSTVSCGAQPVLVLAPGARFPCTVTFNDGTMQTVTVRVVDTAGTVALETPPRS